MIVLRVQRMALPSTVEGEILDAVQCTAHRLGWVPRYRAIGSGGTVAS